MARKILSVGFEVPGGDIEVVDLLSNRSLLDADIILFEPGIPHGYGVTTYQGKACLADDASFKAREALVHWRRELSAALDAGKLVVLFLSAPEIVFVATGQMQYSGTGRNAREARIVSELHSYASVPTAWKYHSATGNQMIVASPGPRFLSRYWDEFGDSSRYELYLEGAASPLVLTKTGGRVVGARITQGKGSLIAVPTLSIDNEEFVETRVVGGRSEEFWTAHAEEFGKRLSAAIVAMDEALRSDAAASPQPEWASGDGFRLPAEAALEKSISDATTQIEVLEGTRRGLDSQLREAGEFRSLLFEQGKPLEKVVIRALRLFGFEAEGFNEDGSEFDAVFHSEEGRFIGEVEGKDSKAINVDKFSQLERNINEDFARDEVSEHAKGVLFGNPQRLQPPDLRTVDFTEKCFAAAKRLNVALVRTADLFAPSRYLLATQDSAYASACRQAIFSASGELAVFPVPPENAAVSEPAQSVGTSG
jgi:hypothetical protein